MDEWMMASWDNDPVKDWIEAQLDGDTGSVPWVLRSDALYPNGHVCFVCWQVQMERNIYNGVSRGVSRQLPCMVSSSTVNGPRCNEWVHLPTHSTAVSEVFVCTSSFEQNIMVHSYSLACIALQSIHVLDRRNCFQDDPTYVVPVPPLTRSRRATKSTPSISSFFLLLNQYHIMPQQRAGVKTIRFGRTYQQYEQRHCRSTRGAFHRVSIKF